MQEQTVQQLQGAAELLRDGVQAAAKSIETAHLEIAEVPYRLLGRVPLVARPAAAVGRVQRDITQLAYRSVRAAAAVTAATVKLALEFHHPARVG